MVWFRFTESYNHTWPSRAMTNYPAGTVANVKREVAERAADRGKGARTSRPAERALRQEGVSE